MRRRLRTGWRPSSLKCSTPRGLLTAWSVSYSATKCSSTACLIEDTHDWFAQDDDGNVWYMGEEVTNYEYDDDDNLIGTDNDGAWEAGVDDALPGIVMWADPEAGVSYYQEYYEDEAEDMGMVVAIGVRVELEERHHL